MAILISQKDKASSVSEGLVRFASSEEAAAGTRNDVAMSPALVKAQLDTQLNNIIDGAPAALDTLNELAAAINDDASVYQTITTVTDDHETRLASLETGATAAAVAAELAVTQAGAGLENDGTYSADATTNYLASATSLKDADDRLDTQIKANADAISALGAGNVTALQNEIDAVEASIGINTDGTYTAPSGTNYIDSATSVRNEATLLDTQIKSNADNIASNDTDIASNASDITDLQTLTDTHESSIGLSASGSYVGRSGSNYLDSATSVVGEATLLDTQVKTNADAIALRATSATVTAIDTRLTTAEGEINTLQSDLATAQSNISSNDTDIADHETRITSLEGASTNQAEVDAIEASVGINTDGSFTANTGGNFISSATTVRGEINALDTAVKTNFDNIASNDSDIATLQSDVAGKADTSVTSGLQTLADTHESSIGLSTSGAYVSRSGSNYIDSATSIATEIGLLDAEISTNATDITNLTSTVNTLSSAGSANASEITALENEIDATQAGAGLSTTGAYTAPGASNYLSAATSLKDADNKLDAQIKTNADNIALKASSADVTSLTSTVNTNTSNISTLNTTVSGHTTDIAANLSAIQSNDSDISALQSGKAAAADLTSLEGVVDTIEASVGIGTDGSFTANTGGNFISAASSVRGEINALDTQLNSTQSDLDTAEASLATAQSDITSLETLADTHESSIGLSTAGAYVGRSGSNYLDSATSIVGELTALDSQAKTNADAISTETSARQSADSTLTSSISTLQSEVDATQTGAGLGTNGAYVADATTNYLSAATSLKDADDKLDTQIKTNADNISTNTSNISTNTTAIATKASSASVTALQSEVDATQAGAGLGTNGSYTADAGSNYITGATDLHDADSLLDAQIKTNADAIALRATSASLATLQSEVDATQSGAGLGTDGSYSANTGANYISAVSSLKAADNALDTQIKTNADAIALRATSATVTALQSEVDATQTGAGLAANGNFVAYSGTNYIDASSDLAGAIELLDTAVAARQTNIDNEAATRATADTNLQSAIDTVEASVGLATDGSLTIAGTNYINAETSVLDAVKTLDTTIDANETIQDAIKSSAGLSANGTKTNYANTNYISNTDSLKAAIEALDSQVSTNATDISSLGSSNIAALQSELDATQSGAGLGTDGSYTANGSSNFIASSTSLKDADDDLDTALKAEETAREAADTAQVDRLEVIEHRSGGIMIDVPGDSAVEMDATLSQFRTHSGPWQIDFSGLIANGAVDIIHYGGQAATSSSQHFIQKNNGDIVFTGNIASGASIRDA